MEYRRFDNTVILRLEAGEEVMEQLTQLAQREQIALGVVSGLGAAGRVTAGAFDTKRRAYTSHEFQGEYEIISLTGTITAQEGKPYIHLHIALGDMDGHLVGGHLNRAEISATAEIAVTVLEGRVNRRFAPEVGLQLMDFS